MDFLELQRDSRVTTGNSGCLLCWPREVQSSIRVAKESWGLLSSDCRANRPHLGLCPEASVPLQGRKGSRGCIPDTPGETGHLSSGIWKLGVFSRRCTGETLPLRVDFIHRVEFGEVSGHRVLIKRGPGNRGPTECGTTHEATSGMSS